MLSELRAIMPLPALFQVADVLLAGEIHSWISGVLPCPPSCFEGAVKYTQPLDIAHGLAQAIERGLDNRSHVGIAQADIRSYYDSLNVPALAWWLHEEGMAIAWASAIARLQLAPTLYLRVGHEKACIDTRAHGSLTGSRVAGALGRIPVLHVLNQRAPLWEACGFQADSVLTVATYVDNMYSISTNIENAVDIMEDLERCLEQNWGLQIKSASRSVMLAAGRKAPPSHDCDKWPVRDVFTVLGHRLDHRGSAWPCWANTKRTMWGAFYKTCGSQAFRRLPMNMQLCTLNRCVLPVCEYRCTRWPFHTSLEEDVNRVQRKMTSILAKVPRTASESDEAYFRRRRREVGVLCKQQGLWALRWAQRVVSCSSGEAKTGSHYGASGLQLGLALASIQARPVLDGMSACQSPRQHSTV